MARDESEREDLLRDATALVERIELAPAGSECGDHVVMGFRSDGAMSVYLGSDEAYHFNSSCQFRRAFCDGQLIKAENGRLVALLRHRAANEVQLLRHPMSDDEQTEFLSAMVSRLRDLMQRCSGGSLVSVGQVPEDADVLSHALDWLKNCGDIQIAPSPHAR